MPGFEIIKNTYYNYNLKFPFLKNKSIHVYKNKPNYKKKAIYCIYFLDEFQM